MSDNEKPKKESKPMNNFFMKILAKLPKIGSMARMTLKLSSFHSPTITVIMVDTFKFTSKSKVWNSSYAGCSIKERPKHHSHNLYSGHAKG